MNWFVVQMLKRVTFTTLVFRFPLHRILPFTLMIKFTKRSEIVVLLIISKARSVWSVCKTRIWQMKRVVFVVSRVKFWLKMNVKRQVKLTLWKIVIPMILPSRNVFLVLVNFSYNKENVAPKIIISIQSTNNASTTTPTVLSSIQNMPIVKGVILDTIWAKENAVGMEQDGFLPNKNVLNFLQIFFTVVRWGLVKYIAPNVLTNHWNFLIKTMWPI